MQDQAKDIIDRVYPLLTGEGTDATEWRQAVEIVAAALKAAARTWADIEAEAVRLYESEKESYNPPWADVPDYMRMRYLKRAAG
jgi:hypothetical protein